MATSRCTVLLLLLAVHGSIQKSTPTSSTYRAAVVELRPISYLDDSVTTLNINTKKHIDFIEQAGSKDADIIVFPELGLTTIDFADRVDLESWSTLISDPSENYRPCINSSIPVNQHVKEIACAAKRNDIYVVINLIEKEPCSGRDCRPDGVFYYISNVVFDREGKIVARYRKSHLLDEYPWLDVLRTPEYSTFETDFGVTFGNVICFDIMYEVPWLIETRKRNITDIVYTSGWFSEMPFLTSIQMQAGWAYIEDVNLLAGGYNRIHDSYSGSGIYAGRQGIVAAILPLGDHEELLVADVRKKNQKTVVTSTPQHVLERNLKLTNYENSEHLTHQESSWRGDSQGFRWRYDKLNAFESKSIDTSGFTVQRLSHNGIDCEFELNITDLNPPITHRLFAFDGVREFGHATVLGSRICVVLQCANDTIDSCGHIQNSTTIFNSIAITAIFLDNGRTVMMPNTLGVDMLPLRNWAFDEHKHKGHISTSISLTTPTQNLVTFGVWGRNFEADIVNTDGIPEF